MPAGMNLADGPSRQRDSSLLLSSATQRGNAGCLIEMGTPMRDRGTGEPILDEDGSPKIGWVPKPVIGCGTNVSPGMHVKTESEMVNACREGIMEFLLVNHPLDCPICDQAGECRLQEFATDYGRGYSRYKSAKTLNPSAPDSGRALRLMMNVVFFVPDAFAFARKWRMTMFWVLSIEAAFPL